MNKDRRKFILDWLDEEELVTSYNMCPKVHEWQERFHSGKSERASINSLTYYFRKLVKEGVLKPMTSCGLGEGAKNEFLAHAFNIFGTNQEPFNKPSI